MSAQTEVPAQVAVAQQPATLGDVAANTRLAVDEIAAAGARGDDLLVFPETYLNGYMFDSADAVKRSALSLGDAALEAVADACAQHGVHTVVGFLERDGDEVYNSAATFGPGGLLGTYRKQHLPFLGADRFVSPGRDRAPRVVSTSFGQVGTMICFDLRFPESARELALQGADIIAMPTAWPLHATFLADHVTRVRALENLVFLAVADRADEESGTQFLGRSQIVGPDGAVVLDAQDATGTFSATVDLARSRAKRLVITAGEYELDVFDARQPDQYGELVRPRPTDR